MTRVVYPIVSTIAVVLLLSCSCSNMGTPTLTEGTLSSDSPLTRSTAVTSSQATERVRSMVMDLEARSGHQPTQADLLTTVLESPPGVFKVTMVNSRVLDSLGHTCFVVAADVWCDLPSGENIQRIVRARHFGKESAALRDAQWIALVVAAESLIVAEAGHSYVRSSNVPANVREMIHPPTINRLSDRVEVELFALAEVLQLGWVGVDRVRCTVRADDGVTFQREQLFRSEH